MNLKYVLYDARWQGGLSNHGYSELNDCLSKRLALFAAVLSTVGVLRVRECPAQKNRDQVSAVLKSRPVVGSNETRFFSDPS